MWHQVGFLADAFQVFKQQGMSVDLISTSETNVTVSLDPSANTLDPAALARLSSGARRAVPRRDPRALRLAEPARTQHPRHPARARLRVRAVPGPQDLPGEPGGERFELHVRDRRVARRPAGAAAARAADPEHRLRQGARAHLAAAVRAPTRRRAARRSNWWEESRAAARLLEIARARIGGVRLRPCERRCRRRGGAQREIDVALGVRDEGELARRDPAARAMPRVSRSSASRRARSSMPSRHVPGLAPDRVLFTPNFAPRSRVRIRLREAACASPWTTSIRSKAWPEVFRGREIFVRIDPGFGRGHHHHVRTAGVHSKFGVLARARWTSSPRSPAPTACAVVGLHAHTGSGIFDVANWTETGALLAQLAEPFPRRRASSTWAAASAFRSRPGRAASISAALDAGVAHLERRFPRIEFWMEPGRFLVAQGGRAGRRRSRS